MKRTLKVGWNTGTVINAANVSETDGIGFKAVAVSNDSSGDTVVVGNKMEADQLAIFNWDTADNL